MAELGEGSEAANIKNVEVETGSIKVSVRDICTGQRIPDATVSVGQREVISDDQGEAVFPEVLAGASTVRVKKHFKDADYLTFLVNKLPYSKKSVTRSWEAKSSEQDLVVVARNKEAKVRIEISVYRVEEGVRFCRKDLKLSGEIDYGHWWIEIGDKSYGWWPEEGHLSAKDLPAPQAPAPLPANAGAVDKVRHMVAVASYQAQMARYSANYSTGGQYGQAIYKTFTGVPGFLNGDEAHRKREKDPYHQSWKYGKTDEDYHPVIVDCRTKEDIYKAVREFALAYSGQWSWIFEFGNNCHTFQIEAMSQLDLKKVRKV